MRRNHLFNNTLSVNYVVTHEQSPGDMKFIKSTQRLNTSNLESSEEKTKIQSFQNPVLCGEVEMAEGRVRFCTEDSGSGGSMEQEAVSKPHFESE